ncbi:hypothetical protein EVAR_83709_1 [Eumeta japonica]|uniref:Helitron helicase-like domain-containing protein n=1 Tax=Eumeta variegata TaxID=151549 RepID=A0A4C1W9E2_EUMVA|nr:hypothetical protein EVAR_83709_1 [Eumeta japonica]
MLRGTTGRPRSRPRTRGRLEHWNLSQTVEGEIQLNKDNFELRKKDMRNLGVNVVNIPGRGPYCFKLHGNVYRMAGSLQPPPGVAPKYAGLFIIDFDSALQYRIENEANKNFCKEIMITLQRMLDTRNPYAQLFKHVKDIDEVTHDLQLQFTTSNAFHPGRINTPTVSEVAAVFVTNDGTPPSNIDFVMYSKRTGVLSKISYLNPHSDPMCYPLLFPCGDSGWTVVMFQISIHYVKIEGSRLAFIRSHQRDLRADSYKGLTDFLNTNAEHRGAVGGFLLFFLQHILAVLEIYFKTIRTR